MGFSADTPGVSAGNPKINAGGGGNAGGG
ncbi:MAG: hypothetical protein JWM15_3602, partial [Cryptosporangiaceae bacterium]|nr:hypothetical protein [Cryptosporangiaceae bacterium]